MFPTRPPKRLGALLSALVLFSLWASSCVDAPSAPEVGGGGGLVLAPVLSLVGPEGPARSEGQEDALSAAFDLVNRFRMEVRRASDNVVVLDTVITVTPGADEYDLSVSLPARPDEQFLVTLTALQGDTPLFRAENIPAKATPQGLPGSPPPAAIQIPLVYAGPGATATAVTVGPAQVVLAPGGSATVGSSVRDAAGSVVAGVPVGWTSSAPAVATVTASGVVTAVGEGVATVTVTTPTNLSASATLYVATGELAYVEGGALKVRGVTGGTAVEQAGGGASQPAWSPDGARLFYVAGGEVRRAGGGVLVEGAWPSVSPDGGKLAVERGGGVWFANDDGSHATAGPSGSSPVWADASTLLVGGGSIQRVRADGTGRETVVAGEAALAALAGDGRIASLAGGALRVTGVGSALVTGAAGRATWSANGRWLVVGTGSGLVLVPSDGSAAAVALPGLGGATDPAFKPAGALAPLPGVTVTGFNPDPPVPGGAVQVLGSGFDWIIRANNRVVWPVRDGTAETVVEAASEGSLVTVMPRNVVAGQVRVETRGGSGLMAFVPQFGSLQVTARAPWGASVAGVGVALSGPGGTYAGTTASDGSLTLDAILPGTYTATLTAPTGWTLVGEATRSLSIGAEASALALEVVPVVASVTLSPAAPTLAVGQSLSVTLVVTGGDGGLIPQVQGLAWRSASAELGVTPGAGLGATLGATFAGEGPGTSRLEVTVAGTAYTFSVTVTSSISGTLTLETGATPAPPAPGVTVQVRRGGTLVAEAVTGADGRYAVAGLFRGTYDMAPAQAGDLLPVPAGQTVTLDEANPSGRADFRMQSFAGLEITARTPWDAAVRDVTLVLLDAAGAEAARGATTAGGTFHFQRLNPGPYTLRISVPVGFDLAGDAARTLVLLPGNQTLALQVTPIIQTVVTAPADLTHPLGSTVDVTLTAQDVNGNLIPQLRSAAWFAGSTGIAVTGTDFQGTVSGRYPSPQESPFELRLELNGRLFGLPVSVTSHISGTVSEGSPPSAPEAGPLAEPGLQAEPEPAGTPGVTVVLHKVEGPELARTTTDDGGRYRFDGLFQGSYQVSVEPKDDLSPTPGSRIVDLDELHPTGLADFTMTRSSAARIELSTPTPTLEALGATTLISVVAYDENDNVVPAGETTFASSNPAVATVSAAGLVTAVTNGMVTVTVTTQSGPSNTIDVIVDQRAASIEFFEEGMATPDSVRVLVHGEIQLGYRAFDANGHIVPSGHRTPTFMPADATMIYVDTTNIAYAYSNKVGRTEITVSMDGVSDVLVVGIHGIRAENLRLPDDLGVMADSLFGKVMGSIYVDGTTLTDVNALATVWQVDGDVNIRDNPYLTNLAGLANLQDVWGTVRIKRNDALTTPPGLQSALHTVGGAVKIWSNPLITNGDLFANLQSVGYDVDILGNLNLQNLDGVASLQHIGENLRLVDNPSLASYGNFPALEQIDGTLVIEAGARLFGAPNLKRVFGGIQLSYYYGYGYAAEPVGPYLEGGYGTLEQVRLPSLQCTQHLNVYDNTWLTHLELPSLQEVGYSCGYAVEAAPARADRGEILLPADLPMARRLEAIKLGAERQAELRQRQRADRQILRDQRGAERAEARMAAATARSAQLGPVAQPILGEREELDAGYQALLARRAAAPFRFQERAARSPRPARAAAPMQEYGYGYEDFVYISYNNALQVLDLASLTSVGGVFYVWNNSALATLALPALSSVGYELSLGYNGSLTSIQIPVLSSVGDDLDIYGHPALTTVQIATGSSLDVGQDVGISYNTINGSVVIGSAGPLSIGWDLDLYHNSGSFTFAAPGLNYVYEHIYVYYNSGLTSFSVATTGGTGTVGYGIDFYDNASLTTLTMPGIQEVGSWVDLDGLPALVALNLSGLVTVGSDVWLNELGTTGQPIAVDFSSVESVRVLSLERFNGTGALSFPSLLDVGDWLDVSFSPGLTGLSFPVLQTMEGSLSVGYNEGLATFSAPELTDAPYVYVEFNNSLTSFNLAKLARVKGSPGIDEAPPLGVEEEYPPAAINLGKLIVLQNPLLTSFTLGSLEEVGYLIVRQSPALASLPTLGPLGPGSTVLISSNPVLTNLDGLAGTTSLYRLEVWGNASLTSTTGLGDLASVADLFFQDNLVLTSITAPSLTRAWYSLEIGLHDALQSVSFPVLERVGYWNTGNELSLAGLPNLTTASFPALTTLHGLLFLGHTGLTNLNGFSALRSAVHAVEVYFNANLEDIGEAGDGLERGIFGIGTNSASPAIAAGLKFNGNAALGSCYVDQLIAHIDTKNPGQAIVGGTLNTGQAPCGVNEED